MRTPVPAFTKEQSRRSSLSANRSLIGTLSALASASSVPSEGEIAAVLDLGQHAGGDARSKPELRHGEIERFAQPAYLYTDPGLERVRRNLARGGRSGVQIVRPSGAPRRIADTPTSSGVGEPWIAFRAYFPVGK